MVVNIGSHTLLDAFPKIFPGHIVRKFLRYLICGFFLFSMIMGVVAWLEFERVSTIKEKQEISDLNLLQIVLCQDLRSVAADLMVLAENESLGEYLASPSRELTGKLEQRYRNFANDRRVYSQVRFIDDDGNEVVRVNTSDDETVIVTEDLLQNKGSRYYFKETIRRNRGEIFVSPLDLNLENGKIETPFNPVLRVGTPVFDRGGSRRGMVMLNYRANLLLERFEGVFPLRDSSSFEILNKEGFWIRGASKDKEWGFMFSEGKTLQQDNPPLWTALQKKGEGQMRLKKGLYSFAAIYPEIEIGRWVKGRQVYGPPPTVFHDQRIDEPLIWYLVLFTTENQLSFLAFIESYRHLFWVFPLVAIGLCGGSLYLAIIQSSRERTLRSLRLLSTSVEQSPAAILLTDPEGRIIYVNPKFERLTGYEKEEVYGENPRIFKSGTTSASVYEDLWQTVLGGNVWVGDFENRRKNNQPYFVAAQIGPVLEESGKLGGLLAIMEDTTETRRLQGELEKKARMDGLTGVLNRQHFMERFSAEGERAVRYGHALTLLSFDIDHFKNINDSFGHHAGDKVLKTFAVTISSDLRSSDLFGRIGGEEFCALLAQTDGAGGVKFAERLRREVEALTITCDSNRIRVTVSIGVTEWKVADKDIEDTMIRADRALYDSKKGGRNQVTLLTE